MFSKKEVLYEVEYYDALQGKRVKELVSEKSMLMLKEIAHRIDLQVNPHPISGRSVMGIFRADK